MPPIARPVRQREREHPFTFFDAAVANDGRVAGVAYYLGIEGGGLGADQLEKGGEGSGALGIRLRQGFGGQVA
jgi:hypothetical protein